MRDAALHLAFDEQRIDLRPAVVDRHVLLDARLAGLAIDLDGGDVRAEREREVLRLEEARGLEARLEARRQILGDVRLAGDLGPADFADLPPARGTSPLANVTRSTGASSRCAARIFAFATILSMHITIAGPPTAVPRLP